MFLRSGLAIEVSAQQFTYFFLYQNQEKLMPATLKTAYGVDIATKYKWIHTQCPRSISCELLHAHILCFGLSNALLKRR